MKRDWDMVRTILLRLEEQPTLHDDLTPESFDDSEQDAIAYHMELMIGAGLIEVIFDRVMGGGRSGS